MPITRTARHLRAVPLIVIDLAGIEAARKAERKAAALRTLAGTNPARTSELGHKGRGMSGR